MEPNTNSSARTDGTKISQPANTDLQGLQTLFFEMLKECLLDSVVPYQDVIKICTEYIQTERKKTEYEPDSKFIKSLDSFVQRMVYARPYALFIPLFKFFPKSYGSNSAGDILNDELITDFLFEKLGLYGAEQNKKKTVVNFLDRNFNCNKNYISALAEGLDTTNIAVARNVHAYIKLVEMQNSLANMQNEEVHSLCLITQVSIYDAQRDYILQLDRFEEAFDNCILDNLLRINKKIS